MRPYGTSGGKSDGTRPGADGASDGGGSVGVGAGVGGGADGVGADVGAGVRVGVGAGVRVGAGVGLGVGVAGAGVATATTVGVGVRPSVGEGPCAGGEETAKEGVDVAPDAVGPASGPDGATLGGCDDGSPVELGVIDGNGELKPALGGTVKALAAAEGWRFAMAGGPDGSSVTPRTLPSSRGRTATARSATPTSVITAATMF